MKRDFSSLQSQSFDLLVCGGGVYGAWTAYDAALRGLSVAIVEQNDWASATSSASSKLIHGGLRYLEFYDFKLVKKSIFERQMLQKIAPYRIWPLRFGVPVYSDSRIGQFRLKLALMLYDWLGNTCELFQHKHLGRTHFNERFPLLKTTQLTAGFLYTDAQTDDARLVLELIAGAINAGAVCVNYCQVVAQLEQNGTICGVKVRDQCACTDQEVHAKQVVFATGPWLSKDEQGHEWCRLAKGTHLVMPVALMNEEALLLTVRSDGRVFFMIPWYGRTILGTTDTNYRGDINQIRARAEDVAYLLAAANQYLNTAWTETDIISCYAGTRVLRKSERFDPSSVSRDWTLRTTSNGAHYSIGGKLTSARQDAASIVDRVCGQLGVNAACLTLSRDFPWMPEGDYVSWKSKIEKQAVQVGIDEECTKWLIRRHGQHVAGVVSIIRAHPDLAERIVSSLPFIFADLLYCAQNEMVIHLSDLLRRRLPLLILAQLTQDDLYRIASRVAHALGWCEATIKDEVDLCFNSCVAEAI